MIVKQGETKPLVLQDCTLDGLLINIYLSAATAGTAVSLDDLNLKAILPSVVLSRDGQEKRVISDNLQIIGAYSALNYGVREWFVGNDIVANAVGVTNVKVLNCFIAFGEHINVKGNDTLETQFQLSPGTFGASISGAESYLEFNPNYSIGYERGTPQIVAKVVQANIPSEKYSMGDGVIKIAFLNFDKVSLVNPVITSVSLQSKQLSNTYNYYDMINRDRNYFTFPIRSQYDDIPYLPQSFVLHAGTKDSKMGLDNTSVNASYNVDQVNAGKNYWVWTSMKITKDLLAKAERRNHKHVQETVASIPPK